MLLIHIIVAMLGLAASTGLYVRPARRLYTATSGLLVLTLTTGTLLVIAHPVHMVRSCIAGLAYTAFVAVALYIANKRLANQSI